jgi:RimJ/RimL family protein N-acetyltransferase
MGEASTSRDPLFFAVVDLATLEPGGVVSFLRIEPAHGSIELGHLLFAPRLARTRTATDALYTMIAWAFEAGYRRVEWKCDALNAPSRSAARRLGFTYEGTFRNHLVTRGRSRDTAWYAMVDRDWPTLRARFDAWLAPDNFDANGQQRSSLGGPRS